MPNSAKVSDYMFRNPLTIGPDESLVKAISMIVEHKLTGLTVSDNQGGVVGILSELDCIEAVLTAIYHDGGPDHLLVKDAMADKVNTCTSSDGIVEVARDMVDTRQRRRPVIENGKLIGQVSSNNILWALMQHSRSQ